MKFGMPTLIEVETVAETAALCAELGLSFVELNTNFPLHQPHLLNVEQLNALAEQYGIFYTIHLNDEMAIAEFNPAIAEGYRKAVAQTIALAKKIGVKKLNMHLSDGAKYTMPDRVVLFYEAYRDAYLQQIESFRDFCEQEIGGADLVICIENTNGFRNFQRAALEILMESPVFALNLDIGHNYCAGKVDEVFYLYNRNRLVHMHMHDAKNGKNDHLALGEGELDLPFFLKLAQECDCSVVLETKTVEGLKKSVQWVKNAGLL